MTALSACHGLLTTATALAVAAHLGRPRPARADSYKFSISLGWTGGESGRHFQHGYTDSLAKLGGTATVTDAGWDGKKQITQIDAMIAASFGQFRHGPLLGDLDSEEAR